MEKMTHIGRDGLAPRHQLSIFSCQHFLPLCELFSLVGNFLHSLLARKKIFSSSVVLHDVVVVIVFNDLNMTISTRYISLSSFLSLFFSIIPQSVKQQQQQTGPTSFADHKVAQKKKKNREEKNEAEKNNKRALYIQIDRYIVPGSLLSFSLSLSFLARARTSMRAEKKCEYECATGGGRVDVYKCRDGAGKR